MSTRSQENSTELRLDYKDLVAGQLIIVIEGVPTTDHDSFPLGTSGLRIASATRSNRGSGNGSPSSPLIEEAQAINEPTAYAPTLFTSLMLAAAEAKRRGRWN